MKQKSGLDNFEFWEKQQQLEKLVGIRLIPLYGMLYSFQLTYLGARLLRSHFPTKIQLTPRNLNPL